MGKMAQNNALLFPVFCVYEENKEAMVGIERRSRKTTSVLFWLPVASQSSWTSA